MTRKLISSVALFVVLGATALVTALLSGCSYAGLQSPGSERVFQYGKFCGKGWPVLTATTNEGQITELHSISPFDDIDYWCKQHDICYAELGFGNHQCDRMLYTGVKNLRFGFDQGDCNDVVHHVISFALVNPLGVDPNQKVLTAIVAVPAVAFEALGFSLSKINDAIRPPSWERSDKRCMSGMSKVGYPTLLQAPPPIEYPPGYPK